MTKIARRGRKGTRKSLVAICKRLGLKRPAVIPFEFSAGRTYVLARDKR